MRYVAGAVTVGKPAAPVNQPVIDIDFLMGDDDDDDEEAQSSSQDSQDSQGSVLPVDGRARTKRKHK